MKILFLDIDGVLNSAEFFDGRKWSKHIDKFQMADPAKIETWRKMIDPVALALLNRFLLITADLYVVVSSSWREVHPLTRLKTIFEMAAEIPGICPLAERVIDRTDVGKVREEAILFWVNRFSHEIERWAALDDLVLDGLEAHHVKTTWAEGLKPEHIERLRELLK